MSIRVWKGDGHANKDARFILTPFIGAWVDISKKRENAVAAKMEQWKEK